jgi:predicted transcriptional regulator
MVFDIAQLKKIRQGLGMTQSAFAKAVGVSQSMIAKIEAGKLDPTYSYVRKIETGIESRSAHETHKARDFMHRGFVAVQKEERLEKVIKLMVQKDVSQIPVMAGKDVVGLVTEADLLGMDKEKMRKIRAEDVMREAPPVFPSDAEQSAIVSVLKFYPLVLIKEKGALVGVITKIDVLKHLD